MARQNRWGSLLITLLFAIIAISARYTDDDTVCPTVKAIRKLHLDEMLGHWFVVQYYASSEEQPEYRCMRADFGLTHDPSLRVNMNFTYAFSDDPLEERQQGNITWLLPNRGTPAHWVHQEETYEGVYNTYVLDAEYKSWALLLHCAEKRGSPRYLSSFILSRTPQLPNNVLAYLRDKLVRYAIDLDYMFPMRQDHCGSLQDMSGNAPAPQRAGKTAKHPLARNHKPRHG